jgi:hypothetical protein
MFVAQQQLREIITVLRVDVVLFGVVVGEMHAVCECCFSVLPGVLSATIAWRVPCVP